MSVLKALMVAVSVAERKRDEARQVLQNAQAACQAAQGQLSQLEGYAEEIQERWGAKEGASLKPEVMYHHHQFMGRLGHAAGLQSGVVADHMQRIEAASRASAWEDDGQTFRRSGSRGRRTRGFFGADGCTGAKPRS
ncbi:flagellar FliJ family protein [Acidovorax temperans]|uniref:flagellar export protein FliJ n=1 Tax=Acidovorax temperans TaxID=80878 RepID=UPI001A947BDB|nr:flagellar FliJ family protein [Acidovorax temperans]MBO0940818.1 flagellar FliJ family protein [Acidovorax temperans]